MTAHSYTQVIHAQSRMNAHTSIQSIMNAHACIQSVMSALAYIQSILNAHAYAQSIAAVGSPRHGAAGAAGPVCLRGGGQPHGPWPAAAAARVTGGPQRRLGSPGRVAAAAGTLPLSPCS